MHVAEVERVFLACRQAFSFTQRCGCRECLQATHVRLGCPRRLCDCRGSATCQSTSRSEARAAQTLQASRTSGDYETRARREHWLPPLPAHKSECRAHSDNVMLRAGSPAVSGLLHWRGPGQSRAVIRQSTRSTPHWISEVCGALAARHPFHTRGTPWGNPKRQQFPQVEMLTVGRLQIRETREMRSTNIPNRDLRPCRR